MKFVFFIVIYLIAAVRGINTITKIDEEEKQVKGLIEDTIKQLIEQLKDSYKDQFDPFNFKNQSWAIQDTNMDLKLEVFLGPGKVTGLLGFSIEYLKIPLFPPAIKYTVKFPKLDADIDSYHLSGSIGALKIFGDGPVKAKIDNLVINGAIKMKLHVSPAEKYYEIIGSDTFVQLEDFLFTLEGWLHDEGRSKLISKLVTNNVPKLMKKFKNEISQEINKLLLKYTANLKIPLPLLKPKPTL